MTGTLAPSLAHSRSGRWLLMGQGLDNFGYGIMTVALPWLVLNLGGSPAMAGLAVALEAIPYALGGVVAGATADLVPVRRMLVSGYFTMAVFASIIPLWSLTGRLPLFALFVFPVLVGAARLMSDSAAIGGVAGLVGPERFVDGQSNLMASWSIGILIGPAIAGAVIAARGPVAALSFESIAYLVAGLGALRVNVPKISTSTGRSLLATVKSGLAFVAHQATIRRLILIGAVRGLLTGGLMAMLVPLLHIVHQLSSPIVGIMLSAGALAGLAVTPVIGTLSRRFGYRRVIAGSLLVTGSAACALALGFGTPIIFVSVAAFYGSQFITSSSLTGARQQRAPLDSQSRVGMIARVVEKSAWVAGAVVTSVAAGPVGLVRSYAALGLLVAALGIGIGVSALTTHEPAPLPEGITY
jgi:MFS family permease